MSKTFLIDKTVDNLDNYYKKNEVDNKIPTFENKETLDKFSESDSGNLLWNGEEIKGGGGGSGTVKSVNNVQPDSNGNVQLLPSNIGALSSDTPLAPIDAEKNTIVGIKYNGVEVIPDVDRIVNIQGGGSGTQEIYVGDDITKVPSTCMLFIDTSRDYGKKSEEHNVIDDFIVFTGVKDIVYNDHTLTSSNGANGGIFLDVSGYIGKTIELEFGEIIPIYTWIGFGDTYSYSSNGSQQEGKEKMETTTTLYVKPISGNRKYLYISTGGNAKVTITKAIIK